MPLNALPAETTSATTTMPHQQYEQEQEEQQNVAQLKHFVASTRIWQLSGAALLCNTARVVSRCVLLNINEVIKTTSSFEIARNASELLTTHENKPQSSSRSTCAPLAPAGNAKQQKLIYEPSKTKTKPTTTTTTSGETTNRES